MTVTEIESKAQFDALRASNKVFFVDFYTDWCGPCKMISPIFDKLAGEAPEGAEFYKINIEEVPDVAAELGIQSIPVFHAYKGSERLDTLRGANPAGLQALVQRGFEHL